MEELGKRAMTGDIRAVSRLIRNIEDQVPNTHEAIKHIFPFTGRAHVVGITGAPSREEHPDRPVDLQHQKE